MIRTRWALATLLATCLLGACSDGDPEPDIADPTASASSSSATVSPSPTVSPSARMGVQETVAAWVEAENEALRTGSTEDLRTLAANKCRGCENFSDSIEDVYGAGGSFEGGAWELINSHLESSGERKAKATAAVRIAAGTTVPEAGVAPVKYEAQNHLMSFELVLEGETWRFSVIAFVS